MSSFSVLSKWYQSHQVLSACPFSLAACPWARVLVRRVWLRVPGPVCWSEGVWLHVPGLYAGQNGSGCVSLGGPVCWSEGVWLHAPGLYTGQKGSGCMPLVCMRVRRGLAERPWSVCGSEGVWLHAPGLYAGQKGSAARLSTASPAGPPYVRSPTAL